MKNIILAGILLFSTSFVVAQESQVSMPLKKYNTLMHEKDSLKEGWQQAEQEKTKIQDSLIAIISIGNKQLSRLKQKNKRLKSQINTLQARMDTLENTEEQTRASLDSLKEAYTKKKAKVEDFEKRVHKQEKQMDSLNKQIIKVDSERFAEGKKFVYHSVASGYNKKSFDDMIKTSSQGQVIRDLKIVRDAGLKRNLEDLKKYFSAQELLSQKYNAQKIQQAIRQLKSISEPSELVSELKENLSNYKIRNDGLKNTIREIMKYDNRLHANVEKQQKEKEQKILSKISSFFYNYKLDSFKDYPYLSNIVIQIMQMKHRDVNMDISGLLNKL